VLAFLGVWERECEESDVGMIPRGKGVFQLFCYLASVGLGGAYRVCIFRSRWVLLHWSVVRCCVDRCTHTFLHVHFSLTRHCKIRKSNSILASYTIHPDGHILKFSSFLTQRVDVQTTPRTDVPASPRLLLPHQTTHSHHLREESQTLSQTMSQELHMST
jgi:hypothetical protein